MELRGTGQRLTALRQGKGGDEVAITFDSIAGGELAEKFQMALAQIGRNILDPNMDP